MAEHRRFVSAMQEPMKTQRISPPLVGETLARETLASTSSSAMVEITSSILTEPSDLIAESGVRADAWPGMKELQ